MIHFLMKHFNIFSVRIRLILSCLRLPIDHSKLVCHDHYPGWCDPTKATIGNILASNRCSIYSQTKSPHFDLLYDVLAHWWRLCYSPPSFFIQEVGPSWWKHCDSAIGQSALLFQKALWFILQALLMDMRPLMVLYGAIESSVKKVALIEIV
jgi:hypothetical protein